MALPTSLPDRIEIPGRLATVVGWWTGLDSDWQAVCLGFLVVVVVRVGVHVPW